MSKSLPDGKPFWLSAYPNEGTLDYFGFRFYRQPLRKYLVRGAAANDFKNAKTLLYYAAITYGFRKQHDVDFDAELSEEQFAKWQDWYKAANYLYIVNRYSKYGEVPDRGFTGANEESQAHFKKFYNQPMGQFDIRGAYSRIYPEQRNWGYLAQFWRPPLDYFRCVLDLASCVPGEYAEECYELLSQDENWSLFVKTLETGIIDREELNKLQGIIDSKKFTEDEQVLARKILFDEDNVTGGENDEYKKSFKLLETLQATGCEGFSPSHKDEFAMVFSYAQLKSLALGENDLSWKILISSIVFEIGICRLYTILGGLSDGGAVDVTVIEAEIEQATQYWLDKNKFGGDLATVEQAWKEKYLSDIDTYSQLFKEMLDDQQLDCAFDGLLQGYIISKIKPDGKEFASDSYQAMTDQYHYFAPQPFFANKKINGHIDFKEFVLKMVMWLVTEQFDFSLDRMNYGQKAKFILSKSEFDEQYLFQIDAREFHENRGIIDMIDACLNLWRTAGILGEGS